MYADDKMRTIGEHGSVAEELLSDVSDIEQKCRAVQNAVKGGYFSLEEALLHYKVSEIEYIPYLLLQHKQALKNAKKQEQVFDTIYAIASIFSSATDTFDAAGKKAFFDLLKISEEASSTQNVLVK